MIIDLEKLSQTKLERSPFEHCIVPAVINPQALQAINDDFPLVPGPANYDPAKLHYGGTFQALLDQLNDASFSDAVGKIFDVQLTNYPSTITVRGQCELSDGNIHTDHWSKILTILLYFNSNWQHEGGRLRLLHNADNIEDYGVEILPEGGNMLAFLRSDHSFHGHQRFVGERRMLQMSWIKPSRLAQMTQKFDRLLTHSVKRISRVGRFL
ncbi:MAG: 2OG-Fe(II) oxygenase [Methylococcales bacterium]